MGNTENRDQEKICIVRLFNEPMKICMYGVVLPNRPKTTGGITDQLTGWDATEAIITVSIAEMYCLRC